MESALSQQKWINAFCIHEAGHITYFSQMGITEYDFRGPRIAYNQEKDAFDGYMVSVKPKNIPAVTSLEGFQRSLKTIAKAYVAGKIFTRVLTDAPDAGEQEDRQNFDNACRMVESIFSGQTIDREESWNQAEKDVRLDLRSPQFRTKAWETARTTERKIFAP